MTVPSTEPLGGTSDVGALHSIAAVAPTSSSNLKDMSNRSAPTLPESVTNLLCAASQPAEQSIGKNEPAGEASEQYEEEDEITPARTVSKKSNLRIVG